MVEYRNTKRSRDYEGINNNLQHLIQKKNEYQNHLNIIASEIFRQFELLKTDYDSGYISMATYVQMLYPFKTFFEQNPPPYSGHLKAEEVLKQVRIVFSQSN